MRLHIVAALLATALPGWNFVSAQDAGFGGQPSTAGMQVPSPADAARHNPDIAARDAQPIMSRAGMLSTEQKQMIVRSVGGQMQDAPAGYAAEISTLVPGNVTLHDLPDQVAEAVPWIGRYKVAALPDRVLLVDPVNNGLVVAVIER